MDLENLLTKRGADLLGVGDFAAVISDPTATGRAIKIGHAPLSDGWPAWAQFARDNAAPWLPIVHTFRWIRNSGGHRLFYVAEIERLQEWRCGRYAALRGLIGSSTLRRNPTALADAVGEHEPDLAMLLYQVRAAFPAGSLDLGPSNWMLRGEQLVLTDPLSYRARVGCTREIAL